MYEIVLERMEEDNDKDRKGVVEAIVSLIFASRSGLYQDSELEPLMTAKGIGLHEWSGVLVLMEDLLFHSSGLLNFSNHDVRRAVSNRYVPDQGLKVRVHRELAKFFGAMVTSTPPQILAESHTTTTLHTKLIIFLF